MQFLCIKVSLFGLLIWIIAQLAKLAGNTVVAICGGRAKAKLLKDLGVNRVIDYHSKDVKSVCFVNPLILFRVPSTITAFIETVRLKKSL